MLLTVHDELVFEVPRSRRRGGRRTSSRDAMEHAVALDVPLVASIGWGADWSDAAPEGH